jgi:hypothetical protein
VTIPADQLKSYQKWKEMANKGGKNYTYSYAHDTACTPFHHGKVCKCDGCMLGKAHKLPYENNPKEYKKMYKPGEYLVSDLWGPVRIATPGGRKRFVTLIDLISDYTNTYFVLKKSEQPEYFNSCRWCVDE